ncbi:radical SAM protein [Oceanicoccus sp. KOV_DT_Chl]|uniref:radical SAM protein n=1 Tax=Oceanicoccus sp. KOV_DT_Chl TaxID=1904639 RepID=UPI000C7B0282|nr:radical SAM protein [Oceanicoccus sp. KOV_DT_Chl]
MKKIYFAHNTCLNSSYDLNVLRTGLDQEGLEIVSRPEDADEIIYSGCSVRSRWVDDAIIQINEASKRAPQAKIHVTGCIANTSAAMVLSKTSIPGLTFSTMPEILSSYTHLQFSEVDQLLSQNSSVRFENNDSDGLQNLRQRVGASKASIVADLQEVDRLHGSHAERFYRQTTKGFVFYDEQDPCEMITVTRSCLYKCTFCSIPQGRGKFESVPLSNIVEKARKAVEQGKHHIVLIGDEIGNYHAPDSLARFPELVESLLALDPALTISVRYIEPKPFLRFSKRILQWSIDGRIRLLYISIQSGSERILKAMNRGYDLARLTNVLKDLRQNSPVVLYGNWLIGFPGEERGDFLETLSLVKELEFHINVAIPFSPRENTPAFEMPSQLDERTMNERVSALTNIIANMKASAMESFLSFLDTTSQELIIDRIRRAECEQYVDDQQVSEPRRASSHLIEVRQL